MTDSGEVSSGFNFERMECATRIFVSGCFQDDINAPRFRGPDPEMCPAIANYFCSERVAA